MTNKNWKMILVAGVLCMVLTPIAQAAVVTDHLVSWWKFDEASGTQAIDSVGTSPGTNPGTLLGSPLPTRTTSTAGSASTRALYFNGSGNEVNCGDSTSLDITDNMTIELWFKVDSIEHTPFEAIDDMLISKGFSGSASDRAWRLGRHTDDLKFAVSSNGTLYQEVILNDVVTANEWHFVSISVSGTQVSWFFDDGQTQANTLTNSGIYANDRDVRIGRGYPNGYYMAGSIDDVRIYDKTLSTTERQQNYDAIPEPATMTLLGLGGIGLLIRRRRRA